MLFRSYLTQSITLETKRIELQQQQADLAALHALSQEQLNKLILNQVWAEELSLEQQAQLVAIHLKQPQLLATQRGELRVGQCYLAACHDLAGLQHAQ